MQFLQRIWRWLDERTGLSDVKKVVLDHPVPPETASLKSGWMYVLGFATLTSFVLQVVTGIILASNYIPATGHAYESLQFITHEAPFGHLLRAMHFYGASAMVVFVTLHMIRVFLTGSYKFPREISWLSGVFLLGLTLLMAYTGQLLRWDENGVWSVAVATQFAARTPLIGTELARFILAGDTLGGATLSRFFAFHVFLFPALIFIMVGLHLYLVIRNGISELPKAGQPVDPKTYHAQYERLLKHHGKPYWPDAAWKEVVFGALLVMTILLLAFVFGPRELAPPPDPTELAADPRPDWYFLWYYALLVVKPHGLEDVFMVYLPLAAGIILLIIPFVRGTGERSPVQRPWAIGVVAVAIAVFSWLTIYGVRAPWVPVFAAEPLPPEVVGTTSGPVFEGAQLFHAKGCMYCHAIEGFGGEYGPDLTHVADRLGSERMAVFILRGRGDMPAYADILTPEEFEALLAFLATRVDATEPYRPPLTNGDPLRVDPKAP